jgi:hypothetical protein
MSAVGGLTQRAADKWDSARFLSLFLALGLSCSQAESRPAHLRLTQAVGRLRSKAICNTN